MPNYCKRFKSLAVANPKETPENLMVARLRCKMWDCEFCAKKNQSIWRAHIIDKINKLGGEWVFITLTAHRNTHKAGKTLENLKRGWKILYDRLRRYFKQEKMEYVMLYERHKESSDKQLARTRYHIHAVLRASITGSNDYDKKKKQYIHRAFSAWLKGASVGVGMGWSCHAAKIENCHGGMVAAYITKYMTKGAQDFGEFPKGMRRIVTSRGVGSPKLPKSEEAWKIRAGLYPRDIVQFNHVYDLTTGEVIKLDYFKYADVYPEEFAFPDEFDENQKS